jgi:hypothetical protein
MTASYATGHPNADYTMHEVAKLVAQHCKDPYAQTYAHAFKHVSPYDHEAIHAQVLYMMSNMSHWRGDMAKECRAKCKEWIKAYNKLMPR